MHFSFNFIIILCQAQFLVLSLDKTPIIYEYINSCNRGEFDIESEIKEVSKGYGRYIFDLGDTFKEEIFTIYNIFKYIVDNNFDMSGIARAYDTRSKTFDEIIKSFNNRVSLIFINHIADYLTKIGIEMGYDEEVKYMITNNGGQVNISRDSSTLNATQNIGTNSEELISLVKEISKLLDDSSIPNDEREIIQESVETIQSELQSNEPKKGLVKSCVNGLKMAITNIPTAIELCNNVQQFIDYVTPKIQ
ncbi:hypothetical protein CDLVIII_0160 [Clostridium sp. DL-VIII]|uniref:hypothetical protein n=1 Tax=Clostridium sp. DL-VIII TaxID=641107 RepID=UPI00023AF80B|nr:hypothetical protein [Clostridium sp. DL-VIII]EHI96899.1 hypothetical protein CDLVIII_0160 [Clostridium sp. DL-VIII]